MGKYTAMDIEDEDSPPQKIPKIKKKIVKPRKVIKMIPEDGPSKNPNPNTNLTYKASANTTDQKKVSIYRKLQQSKSNLPAANAVKLSKGKKRRQLVKSRITFRKQLQQSILNKNPLVQEQASPAPQALAAKKHTSLGSDARVKQQSTDINAMKSVMSNSVFRGNPLGSLKQHLTSQLNPQKP